MALGDSLQRNWYEDRPPPRWTLPVAALYQAITAARRSLYERGWKRSVRLPVPVIVVGNITAGGTGKTPLVIALVGALRQQGFKPGVVSRGFGGSALEPMLLDDDPDPRVVGDEPALIRLRTRAPVAIGHARPQAVRLLLAAGADVVVADDGLQHYALARDVEICVVDGARRFGNGHLLPAGPLREPLSRLQGVDFVVCNGGESRAGEFAMHLRSGDAFALHDPSATRGLESFAGRRVHAVAGIGNPGRFFAMLREQGLELIEHPFSDHHAYVARDLRFGDELPVLMTEKDAVKCRGFAQENWWAVPVRAVLEDEIFVRISEKLVRRP